MKNLKEFKELIARYESITLEEIEEVWEKSKFISIQGNRVAHILTGYGFINSCTLCKSCPSCDDCIYYNGDEDPPCSSGEAGPTYSAIGNSLTSKELLTAFQNRAKYMKSRINNI